MRYVIERMTLADIPRVVEIEALAYPSTWPASAYRKELQENRYAHYIVVRDTSTARATQFPPQGQHPAGLRRFPLSIFGARPQPAPAGEERGVIVGFAGLWLMIDEAHITTIANHPGWRGRGVGELMLSALIGIAYEIGARRMTLEVRVSNAVAQSLYRKYGFGIEGRRKRYYSDNHEDAYIMGTPLINDPQYRYRFVELRQALLARLDAEDDDPGAGQAAGTPGYAERRGD